MTLLNIPFVRLALLERVGKLPAEKLLDRLRTCALVHGKPFKPEGFLQALQDYPPSQGETWWDYLVSVYRTKQARTTGH